MKTVWFKSPHSEGYYGMLVLEPGELRSRYGNLSDPVVNARLAARYFTNKRNPWSGTKVQV